jgi:hypothetical protein
MPIFHLYGEPPPSQPIVTTFGDLVVLPTSLTVQNFRTIGQGVFVRWVPENRMFPQESEVVLNTVLSANALARDLDSLPVLKIDKIIRKAAYTETNVRIRSKSACRIAWRSSCTDAERTLFSAHDEMPSVRSRRISIAVAIIVNLMKINSLYRNCRLKIS